MRTTNSTNQTRTILTLAVVAMASVVLTAASARAALMTELGILDLSANGGINPATGAARAHGDTYRFAFTSSALTDATSSDINYYNTFVQNLANASTLGSGIGAAQGVTWKAIVSTANDDARDNTSTDIAVDGTGESIFLLDGTTRVATDYTTLWGGNNAHDNPINKTENLGTPFNTDFSSLWTGTNRPEYPDPNYGIADIWPAASPNGGPLGDPDGTAKGGLWGFTSGTHWIWRFDFTTDTELPIYALSNPLTLFDPDAVNTVPEPGTAVLATLGLVGLMGLRRRRRDR